MTRAFRDADPIETKEWLEALNSLIKHEGVERAQYILEKLLEQANKKGIFDQQILIRGKETSFTTPYCNTIPQEEEPKYPGDLTIEKAIEAVIRWNAVAMVLKKKRADLGVGGAFIILCLYRNPL